MRTDVPNMSGCTPDCQSWTPASVDAQGHWQARDRFIITGLGSYQLQFRVRKWFRTIGYHVVSLTSLTPYTQFDAASLLKPYLVGETPKTRQPPPVRDRASVSIFYVSTPNFNETVFEHLLLQLNPLLRSIELQVVDSDLEGRSESTLPSDGKEYLSRNFLFDLENGTIVHPSRLFATP